jgi:hypothetical protein
LIQDAAIRNIEVVGEAANNIQRVAPDFAADHCDVPWMVMYTMRNRVSHGYEKVDLEIVWNTIKSDFPPLREKIGIIAGKGWGLFLRCALVFFYYSVGVRNSFLRFALFFLLLLPEG